MRSRVSLGLALVALALPTLASAQTLFDQCGTLSTLGSCVVFTPDGSSAKYALNDAGSFVAGERARVLGTLEATCNAACAVAGCVTVGEITFCEGAATLQGTLLATSSCFVIDDDHNILVRIENAGGIALGTRVTATGSFGRDCGAVCSGVRACLLSNTIAVIPPPPPPPTGGGQTGGGDTGTANGDGGVGPNPQDGGTGGSTGGTSGGSTGSTGGSGGSGGATGTGGTGSTGDANGSTDDTGDETPDNPGILSENAGGLLCPLVGFGLLTLTAVGLARARRR